MHKKAAFLFWITLSLYVLTLIFVTYVGVYLTYVTIPIIVISGLIMVMTETKDSSSHGMSSAVNELGKATASALEGANDILDKANSSLELYNRKQTLIRARTAGHRENMRQLRIQKIEPEVHLKYAKSVEQREIYRTTIDAINDSIREIEQEMLEIEKQCEMEVARSAG